ncbi:TPA: lytic murein transglycosylase B [Aeromonas hydrophila]|uniref:lytic murein transglycosylase B n=1 Tax=Aeromonas TaxID=642 RepID=UPI000C3282CA|nr:lytic murein transglycosylase B [Aeromonas hydrophila]MCP3323462.1 lytic murein transglycosylase B [Aeromonas hydrophila]PKD22927.1 lytic murein transglycosylase B [Aeromonas hydrophila]TNH79775.1 lytic murein transglycosylase B [Aeromonas hydrophila]WRK92543.1 lytic murein transglycosylase B [Aeromonas hydrophila]HAT2714769.1 lytic murein transglycosylase B [Aeromonas hydrophila]
MRLAGLLLSLVALTATAAVEPPGLARLAEQQQVPLAELQAAAAQASLRQEVLDTISKPWEAKPWHRYRPLFITPERIRDGVDFWQRHAATLARAEQTYQVPASLIVAIIGIETFYGRQMGRHPVLDSLYTLGFHYPERANFFAKEFAQLVLLAREEKWPLTRLKGSYAGAMGMGQFMPSSYRHYAVDFDGDGKRDLFANPVDAIGSVAHYFAEHQWRWGESPVEPALIGLAPVGTLLGPAPELTQTWAELATAGIELATPLAPDTPVKLLALEQADGPEYWVARHNFYVITRYNRSPLYAMAVHQLSQAIQDAYALQPQTSPAQPDLVAGRL